MFDVISTLNLNDNRDKNGKLASLFNDENNAFNLSRKIQNPIIYQATGSDKTKTFFIGIESYKFPEKAYTKKEVYSNNKGELTMKETRMGDEWKSLRQYYKERSIGLENYINITLKENQPIPVIRQTDMPISDLLIMLARGDSKQDIIKENKGLSCEILNGALEYAVRVLNPTKAAEEYVINIKESQLEALSLLQGLLSDLSSEDIAKFDNAIQRKEYFSSGETGV